MLQRRVASGHRHFRSPLNAPGARPRQRDGGPILHPPGHAVPIRSLEIYQHIGAALATRTAAR